MIVRVKLKGCDIVRGTDFLPKRRNYLQELVSSQPGRPQRHLHSRDNSKYQINPKFTFYSVFSSVDRVLSMDKTARA